VRTNQPRQTDPLARRTPVRVPGPRAGFTLVELLLVIGIIALLVTLVTAVGSSALSGGRARQTQDAIRVVDTAVTTYYDTVGTAPPAFVAAFDPDGPVPDGNSYEFEESFAAYPLADAVDMTEGNEDRTTINSIGLFIRALEDQGLEDVISSVSSELLTRWDGDYNPVEPDAEIDTEDGRQPELRTILDGWGRPLRFVHPAWDGIITVENNEGERRDVGEFGEAVRPITEDPTDTSTDFWLAPSRGAFGLNEDGTLAYPDMYPIELIRRDRLTDADREAWTSGDVSPIGDSDGGYTVGSRPYIYSAGADGDPSTTEGNVYTTVPRFAVD